MTKKFRELPNNWTWVTIEEVGEILTGTTPSKKNKRNYGNFLPLIKPPQLNDGLIYSGEDYLSEYGVNSARILPKNSVLVSCIGNLGKTGINTKPIAFNQQINAIIFDECVLPRYGLYYFQTNEARQWLSKHASATTISIINKTKFSKTPFPLPPLDEQCYIVSKIEELFSQLEAGVAGLKQAQAGLKRYRASVLKSAFEGRLVPPDPNDEPIISVMRRCGKKPITNPELNILPKGWEWGKVGDITSNIAKIKPKDYYQEEFRYIDISSVDNQLHKITKPKTYLPEEAPSRARQLVSKNDIVFSTVRTYLENIAIIPESLDGQIASTGFSVLRVNKSYSYKLLFYYCLTDKFLQPLNDLQRGTSYPAVRDGDVRNQPIPIMPLNEQVRLVNKIEKHLSVCTEIERSLSIGLLKADKIRQSILKYAFNGRLIENN
jgi:type I restriction enzyme, S subunit